VADTHVPVTVGPDLEGKDAIVYIQANVWNAGLGETVFSLRVRHLKPDGTSEYDPNALAIWGNAYSNMRLNATLKCVFRNLALGSHDFFLQIYNAYAASGSLYMAYRKMIVFIIDPFDYYQAE